MWSAILRAAFAPKRSNRPSYNSEPKSNLTTIEKNRLRKQRGQAFLVMSVLCHARARETSNWLSKYLGVYLVSSGTKRRVVDMLSSFGVVPTWSTIHSETGNIAEAQKVRHPLP